MELIEHKYVEANGLKHHVAEIGSGSTVVLFLHGFPEIWYTWRFQMIAVAKAGYRAIAPDFRGYGLSDKPPVPEDTTFSVLVADLPPILEALKVDKVFVIGQDFGSMVAYRFALEHPERILGVATLGVPFTPPGPFTSHQTLPEGFYISRWNEPGRAEADFGKLSAKTVIKNIYTMFSRNEIPIAKEGQEIMDLVEPSTPLPSWFTDEDLAAYGDLYEKSGFQTSLAVPYRSLFAPEKESGKNVEDPRIEVPALYMTGEKDYLFKFPGVADFVKSGEVKKYVPNLEMIFLPEGTHFISEQFPDEVNHHILTFLQCNTQSA
ncbi:hypothetical protein ACET3Z_028645 [Daucus carota]